MSQDVEEMIEHFLNQKSGPFGSPFCVVCHKHSSGGAGLLGTTDEAKRFFVFYLPSLSLYLFVNYKTVSHLRNVAFRTHGDPPKSHFVLGYFNVLVL